MTIMEKPRIAPNSSGARNAPFLKLEDAIERARTLYQKAKRGAINVATAASYLGYSPKASSFSLTIAAIKKYGMIIDEGSSEDRRVRLSDLAIQILADTRDVSPDRDAKIRHAALLPKAHRELWERFGHDCPDDETLEIYLKLEKGYTEDAARNAVKVYRATILYACLHEGGVLGDVTADDADADSAVPERLAGRRISAESQNAASEWSPSAACSPVRTLSIPLKGARTFDFRYPLNLNNEDFAFIVENMKLWERQIIASEE
jgi:hypothetical protein